MMRVTVAAPFLAFTGYFGVFRDGGVSACS